MRFIRSLFPAIKKRARKVIADIGDMSANFTGSTLNVKGGKEGFYKKIGG